MRTEKDIGSENPETWAVSGFFRAVFQGGIQKISFPKNDLWGGLELKSKDLRGRFCGYFRRVCSLFSITFLTLSQDLLTKVNTSCYDV